MCNIHSHIYIYIYIMFKCVKNQVLLIYIKYFCTSLERRTFVQLQNSEQFIMNMNN